MHCLWPRYVVHCCLPWAWARVSWALGIGDINVIIHQQGGWVNGVLPLEIFKLNYPHGYPTRGFYRLFVEITTLSIMKRRLVMSISTVFLHKPVFLGNQLGPPPEMGDLEDVWYWLRNIHLLTQQTKSAKICYDANSLAIR